MGTTTSSDPSLYAQGFFEEEESTQKTSIGEQFVKGNNLTIKKLDPASHYQFKIVPMFSTVGDPNPNLEGSKAEISGTTIPATPPMPHQLNISIHEVQLKMEDIEDLVLAPGARFKHFILSYFKVNSTTAIPKAGSPNEQIAVDSTWTISGLAMGTDYHFRYKYVTTMGDSQLSPPLAVKTPYNKTDLDEFRDSLGLDEMKEELLSGIADAKDDLRNFSRSGDTVLEDKMNAYHWRDITYAPLQIITLEGSTAGPDRGHVYYQGRPLCAEDASGGTTWNIQAAKVICRMLGFSGASQFSEDSCPYGDCPPKGIPFAMSGFKCTGSETHIVDCPHDPTVPDNCGDSGVTSGGNTDIVGVECA